jgi:hypothetical protein
MAASGKPLASWNVLVFLEGFLRTIRENKKVEENKNNETKTGVEKKSNIKKVKKRKGKQAS